jgi:hypothetical protein
MNGVPIGRKPVVCHVLAHWGNNNAVSQFEWAKLNGSEKLAHAV